MQSSKEINKKTFLNYFSKDEKLTILDVGTYDGKDSLEFKKLFPESNIYSFEADERSVDIFNKVVGDVGGIHLIETALSDIDGEITWYASDSETRRHYDFEDGWSASSSLKKPDNHLNIFKDISFSKDTTVKSKRLDTWMNENKQLTTIDIMWVDVNGGENEFLDGALETIRTKVQYLYIEFNGVDDKTLYEGCPTADEIKEKVGCFEQLGTYNFLGNFGNILLKNKDIK